MKYTHKKHTINLQFMEMNEMSTADDELNLHGCCRQVVGVFPDEEVDHGCLQQPPADVPPPPDRWSPHWINVVLENSHAHYSPGQDISIDEAMIKFNGHLSFKQYIKGVYLLLFLAHEVMY